MGDIGRRISRYRLARYAPDRIPIMRRLRIVWLVAVVWLAWAALISEHSFYRTWRLDRENTRTRHEFERVRAEVERLDADARDPAAERLRAERQLREQHGMAKPGEIIYMIQPRGADTLAN
jgi:cell division protein FtsB